jgi:hypothetical protein
MCLGKNVTFAIVLSSSVVLLLWGCGYCVRIARIALAFALIHLANANSIDRAVAIRSGCDKIPQVRQIDRILGNAVHRVSSRMGHDQVVGRYEWSSEVYFGGRYELVMWVDVEVDQRSSEISTILDAPKFRLLEVGRVDLSSERGPSISYQGQREFNAAEWERVVEADGDFSVIGIEINNSQPIANFDEMIKWMQR